MSDLERALKDLSESKFESLIHQLLLAKYPGAGIQKADGRGGDQGIDSFGGDLSSGPAIWQCKHFTKHLGSSQKQQILESIETAFKWSSPTLWTLCIPINLQTKEHRWFQRKVRDVYGHRCEIELMAASHIMADLIRDRALRDAFFPDSSISNVLRVSELAMGTKGATSNELGDIATEYAEQYLMGKMDLESRLRAVMSIGESQQELQAAPQNGLVMLHTNGSQTTRYFARDIQSYNRDPISFHIKASPGASEKIDNAAGFGLPAHIPAGELFEMVSDSPLIRSIYKDVNLNEIELSLVPTLPPHLKDEVLVLHFVAGTREGAKELDNIPFKITNVGSQGGIITSNSQLPIIISIKIGRNAGKGATVNLALKMAGAEVRDAKRVMDFIDVLQSSQELSVYNLEFRDRLVPGNSRFSNTPRIEGRLRNIIADAAIVSEFFHRKLYLPSKLYAGDIDSLTMLKRIATGETFSGFTLDASFHKGSANEGEMKRILNDGGIEAIRLENDTEWQASEIFGTTISPGPVRFEASDIRVISAEQTLEKLLEAQHGDVIPLRMHCKGVCRFTSLRSTTNPDPRAVFSRDGFQQGKASE